MLVKGSTAIDGLCDVDCGELAFTGVSLLTAAFKGIAKRYPTPGTVTIHSPPSGD